MNANANAENQRRLEKDPDFILMPKYRNSLRETIKHHPDGLPPKTAARALGMSLQEFNELEQQIIKKLRNKMLVA